MSVRQFLSHSNLVRRQFTIPFTTPRLLPILPSANSLFSRSYAAFTGKLPRDGDIRHLCREIQFIDAAGKFQGLKSLDFILSRFDRELYHLVCINPHVVPEPPICKLISKEQLGEEERAAYHAKKTKKQSGKDPAKTVKTIEISWATAPNDFGHKLKRINEFLQKGNRVEVILGVKKGMAKQPLGKMVELVGKIKEEAEKSGKEWKPAEGNIGVQYMIYLEGNRPKKPVEELKFVEDMKTPAQGNGVGGLMVGEESEVVERPKAEGEVRAVGNMSSVEGTRSIEEVEIPGGVR